MINNPSILTNVFGYNKKDVEFERVISDILNVDIDYGIEIIFDYYRRHGFPHYTIREYEKHDHIRKLQRFDVNRIFKDNKIVQTMHCLRLAWTYFPHFWEVRCGNAKYSPMEIYLDDDKFKSTIRKCWKWNRFINRR